MTPTISQTAEVKSRDELIPTNFHGCFKLALCYYADLNWQNLLMLFDVLVESKILSTVVDNQRSI